jgi:hypothetical protein
MRTKEVNGWIYLNQKEDFSGAVFHVRIPDNFSEMKGVAMAKLLIKIPERKVEITESQFEKLRYDLKFWEDEMCPYTHRRLLQKLFGKESP